MRRNSQLSMVLHILLHLAEQDAPVTSEVLAKANNTNPVVIRRNMAGLRKKGYVRSGKGHGGGWILASNFSTITLLDIYKAIGSPPLFAIANPLPSGCLVERAVNDALNASFQAASELLLSNFSEVTLEMLKSKLHQNNTAGTRLPVQTCELA